MRTFICCVLLFLFSDLRSQVTEANFNFSKVRSKPIIISTKFLKQIIPAFPIGEIEIIDGRFDNGLGYFKPVNTTEYLKFAIDTNEIKKYYASHLAASSADTACKLLCIIKKLLLSNNIYESEGGNADLTKNNILIRSGGMIIVEFFAGINNSFIPLYRFDSTMIGNSRVTVFNAPDYLSEMLTTSLKKLETVPWNTLKVKAKRFNMQAIESSVNQRFDLSLNKTPIKGVYKSFSDFINNKPNTSEFSITNTGKADFLYMKDSKQNEILQRDIWGYCDGKDYFIYTAENFFKLHPTGKTFSIYGAKDYDNVRVFRLNFNLFDAAAPNSAYSKARTRNKLSLTHELLILDMDTGEIF